MPRTLLVTNDFPPRAGGIQNYLQALVDRLPPDEVAATVNLARIAVEHAALDAMRLVARSLGLSAFVAPDPIERIGRDLATYLRQPAPDETLTEAAAWLICQGRLA